MKDSIIINADCLEYFKQIPDNSIDLILTSPPYFNQRKYSDNAKEVGQERDSNLYLDKLHMVFQECVRVCSENGNIVFNLGDKYHSSSLSLIPYRFAISALSLDNVKLINSIMWIKTNPTPNQHNRKLVNSYEPFFHFVKSKTYYYDIDSYLKEEEEKKDNILKGDNKGKKYIELIQESSLTQVEKDNALKALNGCIEEYKDNKISDFRMKIRGVHKQAFGGQSGGRNNEIQNNGFTIIKMFGRKMKKDVISSSVCASKDFDHPAVFPEELIVEFINLLCPVNGIVLDPFCGSGTTLVAAKKMNRKFLGIDLNKNYCKIAEKRILNFA